MKEKTKTDKFQKVYQEVFELSFEEQNLLFKSLLTRFSNQETTHETPLRYPILFSSIWFVILEIGGLLHIKPLWFRICLLPILGIPITLFYIWDYRDEGYKISFLEFCMIMLYVGPVYSLFGGLALSMLLYLPLKWIGIILF